MGCRQRLDAGDAGHDPDGHVHVGARQPPGNAQRAVVERRIAPHQQCDPAALRQMQPDLFAPDGRDGVVPRVDGLRVIPFRIADRHIELGDLYGTREDRSADRAAQVGQIGLCAAFARQQDQVGLVHHAAGLCGQVIGIAGADADQVQPDHAAPPAPHGAIMWKKVPVTWPRRDPVSATASPLASVTRASGSSRWSTMVE